MAAVAFSDLRDILEWGQDVGTIHDQTTGLPIGKTNGVKLKGSNETAVEACIAISEIGETQSGLKVKLHNKVSALEKLGKYLGLFRDKDAAGTGENSLRGFIEAVQRQGDPLPINNPNASRLAISATTDAPAAVPVSPK